MKFNLVLMLAVASLLIVFVSAHEQNDNAQVEVQNEHQLSEDEQEQLEQMEQNGPKSVRFRGVKGAFARGADRARLAVNAAKPRLQAAGAKTRQHLEPHVTLMRGKVAQFRDNIQPAAAQFKDRMQRTVNGERAYVAKKLDETKNKLKEKIDAHKANVKAAEEYQRSKSSGSMHEHDDDDDDDDDDEESNITESQ